MWHDVVAQLDSTYAFQRLSLEPELKRLRFSPMTLDDLEDLKRDGHKVGAHSWSHRPLALLDEAALAEDFGRCVRAVGQVYNTAVFCYPFGRDQEVTPAVAGSCESAGFSAAFINTPNARRDIANQNYGIPRMSLPDDDNPFIVHAKLSGLERFIKRALGRG
jgi:peptidoglycan/xylan/chitin deacetylase (PgdA/CDA1 family)